LKGKFLPLFKLNEFENPDELAEQIEYLLEDDRFLCPVENYEVRTESPKALTRAPKLSLKLKKNRIAIFASSPQYWFKQCL